MGINKFLENAFSVNEDIDEIDEKSKTGSKPKVGLTISKKPDPTKPEPGQEFSNEQGNKFLAVFFLVIILFIGFMVLVN